MKKFATILLVAVVAVLMGFLDVARGIDADELIAKKVGKEYGLEIEAKNILRIGTLTSPSVPNFEIAKTDYWAVAEKLASEGWELMGAVSYTERLFGSLPATIHVQYIFRRLLKK